MNRLLAALPARDYERLHSHLSLFLCRSTGQSTKPQETGERALMESMTASARKVHPGCSFAPFWIVLSDLQRRVCVLVEARV